MNWDHPGKPGSNTILFLDNEKMQVGFQAYSSSNTHSLSLCSSVNVKLKSSTALTAFSALTKTAATLSIP